MSQNYDIVAFLNLKQAQQKANKLLFRHEFQHYDETKVQNVKNEFQYGETWFIHASVIFGPRLSIRLIVYIG